MKRDLVLCEAGRAAAVVLIALLLVLMAGTAPHVDVPLEDLEALTAPLLREGEAQKGEGRMLRRFYGLNPADFEGALLYYPSTNMGVEELLLVKLADTSQGEAVQAAIENRLAAQKESFDGYGVEQTDMLNNSTVTEIRGRYVLFAVSGNAQQIRSAFLGAL